MTTSLAERFARHVDTSGACHLWTGAKLQPGAGRLPYGTIKVAGRKRLAHVVSYEIHKGPVPAGKVVMHACDVPACVNPAHLSAGSLSENLRDAWARGRRKKAA